MSAVQPVLDHSQHAYTLAGKPLVSVSKVTNALFKKSFDGVDEAILKNAADRGIRLENYGTTLLRTGTVTTEPNERLDVLERLECFERWYLRHKPVLVGAQMIVWDEIDGVAGTLDWLLFLDGQYCIVDCKCTSQPEKTWIMQLGAYATMLDEFPADRTAVLHINPKYKDGYMWREYDTEKAIAYWRKALDWYRILQDLKAESGE